MPKLPSRILVLAGLAALAACGDTRGPVVGADAPRTLPGPVLTTLDCNGSVAGGTVSCREQGPGGAGSRVIVTGTNGTIIHLVSSNLTTVADTFSFDVTVLHRIVQSLGTTDGTTAHASGVRVFFSTAPYVTSKTDPNLPASVSVLNEDGAAVFENSVTSDYFQYAGLLVHNTTSAAKRWKFLVNNVNTFSFQVKVWGEVKYPNGWTTLTPANPYVGVGQDDEIRALVRDVYGQVYTDSVAWTSSNTSVVTVVSLSHDYGGIHGVSSGTAWVKAVSV
ncbi:MAG TPA: hypothetical protein VLK84_28010, partial [Longimicrobium sp.]|nr:hypothetical protein [Longimicrobium sp.]